MNALDELMTVPEAARELGMSRSALHSRLVRGDMAGRKVHGRLWMVSKAEVERWKEIGRLSPGRKRQPRTRGAGDTTEIDHPGNGE